MRILGWGYIVAGCGALAAAGWLWPPTAGLAGVLLVWIGASLLAAGALTMVARKSLRR